MHAGGRRQQSSAVDENCNDRTLAAGCGPRVKLYFDARAKLAIRRVHGDAYAMHAIQKFAFSLLTLSKRRRCVNIRS